MKKYYYVGVISNNVEDNEMKFVYKLDKTNKIAYWKTYKEIREDNEKPLLFKTKKHAEQITQGLCMNFNLAMIITSYVELK